jgi:hypothetical protein
MKRRGSGTHKSTPVPPIAIVGDDPEVVDEVSRRLAPHWPLTTARKWSEVEGADLSGIVVTDGKGRRKAGGAPVLAYAGDLRDLNAFAAQVLAYHYTGIASVAEVMREVAFDNELTVKQTELICVHCAELSRREILKRLGISENTLKTRIRLLSRVFKANGGMTQVAHGILRKAAQSAEERARPARPVPLPPKVSAPDAPKRKAAGRATKRKSR